MNAKDFVANWVALKADLLERFFDRNSGSELSRQLAAMQLSLPQEEQLRVAVDGMLTDAMYSLLLGLDGAASIGAVQQAFTIHDEGGDLVARVGELEAEAYRQLHGAQT